MAASTQTSTPFGDAAEAYRDNNWPSVVPLPPRAKKLPPKGFTGAAGVSPDADQIREWIAKRPNGNIALVLPDTVIGIDVDGYGDKAGAQTLADAEERWGTLPATWMSTSRDDGVSAIRYYRVPSGKAWASWVGGSDDGVEIIRHGHRYAVAPPSIHPEGRVYRWVTPEGLPAETIPSPEDLTELPDEWVEGLATGATQRVNASAKEVEEFLAGLPDDDGLDDDVHRIVTEFSAYLETGKPGRHDEMLRVTRELAIAGATGAQGVPTAMATAEDLFTTARTVDGVPTGEAVGEWSRGLAGAVGYLPNYAAPLEPFEIPADLAAAYDRYLDAKREAKRADAKSYNEYRTEDAHLGARIAEEHLRGNWAWSAGLGWLNWDGRRWENVPEQAVQEAVRRALIEAHSKDFKAATKRLSDAQEKAANDHAADTEEYKSATKAASKSHDDRVRAIGGYFNLGKIKAVLSIAKGMLIEPVEKFDTHPYLLNVGNGVVDLRTGDLGPHRPELCFTKITEVDYRPGAVHADWDAALQAIPEDTRGWLQVRFGQAATGFTPSDDTVPFLYGGGANGKSTIVTGITKALGDFAIVVPEKVLLTNPGDHPTEMMTLHGRRLTLLEELPQGRYLDAKRLKSIAGTDRITARLIGRDNISWEPTHSMFVTTNYELRVDENDHGTWRRLARVPFPYRFGHEVGDLPADSGLRPRIRDGRDGQHEAVLAWLVAGAVKWAGNGETIPKAPQSVLDSTKEWRGTTDVLGRFLEEMTELDEGSAVKAQEFYEAFADWCTSYGHRAWGDQLLWERFRAHDWMTSGAVTKTGKARLGGRRLSSRAIAGCAPPTGPSRYVFGLRFGDLAGG